MKGNWRSARSETQESNWRFARSGSQESSNKSQKSSRRTNPLDENREMSRCNNCGSIFRWAYACPDACPDACEVKEAYEVKEATKEIKISKDTDGVKPDFYSHPSSIADAIFG